jgi:hypothetical protein
MLTLFFAFTSAPFASSASTTPTRFEKVATMSGVSPSCRSAGEHRSQRLSSPFDRPSQTSTRCVSRSGPAPAAILPPAPRPQKARMMPPPLPSPHTDPSHHMRINAHLLLRLHVGALRQQGLNHLQIAVLRGQEEWRPSVLRRRRASQSAPSPASHQPRAPPRVRARPQPRTPAVVAAH